MKLDTGPGLDVRLCPAAEGGGTAGLVHQAHHNAQDDQEDQNANVVAVGEGGHNSVVEGVENRALKGEVGVEKAAHQDSDKQGGVDLLGNQSQCNGDDRGQQGHRGIEEIAGRGDVALACAGLAGDGLALVGQDHTQRAAVGTLDHLGAADLGGVASGGKGGGDHSQEHHH